MSQLGATVNTYRVSPLGVMVKGVVHFFMVHLLINVINYVVAYVHFTTCYNLHTNVFVSFVYSSMYNNSDYCMCLSSIMYRTCEMSKGMWHTMCAWICIKTFSLIKHMPRIAARSPLESN